MEASYWQERWNTGQIGFHEGRPNDLLQEHIGVFTTHRRIFVPLAGKAQDLLFLRDQGHDVVGVEFVELACQQFFAENRLPLRVEEHDAFRAHVVGHAVIPQDAAGASRPATGSLELWCGDVFDATPARMGRFDGVYDRAACVALDPATRVRYAELLHALLVPGGRMLLVTFTYDQDRLSGPPWSVDAATVHALFGDGFVVDLLKEREIERGPKFLEAGVARLTESIYVLTRR